MAVYFGLIGLGSQYAIAAKRFTGGATRRFSKLTINDKFYCFLINVRPHAPTNNTSPLRFEFSRKGTFQKRSTEFRTSENSNIFASIVDTKFRAACEYGFRTR